MSNIATKEKEITKIISNKEITDTNICKLIKYKTLNLINIETDSNLCNICCNDSIYKITIKTVKIKENDIISNIISTGLMTDTTLEFEAEKIFCSTCNSETFIIKYLDNNINNRISESEYLNSKYDLLNKIWKKT